MYFLFVLFYVFCVCTYVLLPPGVNPIAVKYISYHIIYQVRKTMKNSAGQLAFQPRCEPDTSLIQVYNITAIPASKIKNSN